MPEHPTNAAVESAIGRIFAERAARWGTTHPSHDIISSTATCVTCGAEVPSPEADAPCAPPATPMPVGARALVGITARHVWITDAAGAWWVSGWSVRDGAPDQGQIDAETLWIPTAEDRYQSFL